MLEFEDEEEVEFSPTPFSPLRTAPMPKLTSDLQPWVRTVKSLSVEHAHTDTQYSTSSKFLATVNSTIRSRNNRMRNKMSLQSPVFEPVDNAEHKTEQSQRVERPVEQPKAKMSSTYADWSPQRHWKSRKVSVIRESKTV
jgi:hypothetical protein